MDGSAYSLTEKSAWENYKMTKKKIYLLLWQHGRNPFIDIFTSEEEMLKEARYLYDTHLLEIDNIEQTIYIQYPDAPRGADIFTYEIKEV